MSKEMSTREAVEEFKNWIEYEKTNKDKINKAEELITVQETILNLIQKLEEENKKKDEINLHSTIFKLIPEARTLKKELRVFTFYYI